MKPRIDLITLWTDDVLRMVGFYRDVLGFTVKQDLGSYVEFESEGVRFSVCERTVMVETLNEGAYREESAGQIVELAFPCDSPEDVDRCYRRLIADGATPVAGPADMPWGQRTAFFADPDGNIHEIFVDLPKEEE